MEPIIRAVVLSLVQGSATGSRQSPSNSLAAATLWAVASAVLATAAIAAAAVALWLWQAASMGPIGATLVVSGMLLAAALAAWAALRRALVQPKHSPPASSDALDLLLRESGRLFQENKGAALAAAFAAGLAAERYQRDK
ncbi:hypothetical protein [Magnetospirillum moscoviense]|uniref:Uncharacterized protein n=1 Tax=Magnetospirillum moscoviense TaxID=1437059 RepID=A0A178MS41_9PROT|nr:hypothetical protein [Magnetospirillum moscoviense]MBF0324517.1 hypothetical protein [Alphaproteobacteria bacterium]OAN51540.1 hypothetical protein A6A05_01375 [Magnetospirillum moscoviense]